MSQSQLIVAPAAVPDDEGSLLSITPESAGWSHVGFQVIQLAEGQTFHRETGELEVCLVLLSGKANVRTEKQEWLEIGQRMNVFEGIPPFSVYVPNDDSYEVQALTKLELAICSAPGRGNHLARLITPEQVGVEKRGYGNIERQIHNILPEQEPADSLLVVEVFTPNGHWSSYPPHKHDQDDLPNESLLEETYYFRIQPENGFAIQRVYSDDCSIDETLVVKDGQAVLVHKGYHPVSAPPGYDCYYLNVMAGPVRTWKFHNDPDHEWIMTKPSK
ncbi:5-deoxy-glucuronate isomerase [Paenibacillus baekrokdamisoli]|uniref:5-deoxy-glucuronate isomerase n=1 Tax=Paenibacillus baekrokdamisoli TaxID=1712516 RepID=A0A3G9IYX5_9BACL|nr:5-deoxy-glucuronate isomerase [Paenibacillus baekrokdamisoli]MBB3068945.1 5-deoxy-glucuronate isomerase [Paenibacillus baekrokdamisoli]BBH23766.1 5-deoxy-glucuronate isomerase [Paenibacillus baekrokdamisoli]